MTEPYRGVSGAEPWIQTPEPETLEQALEIISQLKCRIQSLSTEDSRYRQGRHDGYSEGYQDGKDYMKSKLNKS